MEFKIRLRDLRTEQGLTQQDIAKQLCVSKMAVSHWEKGDSEPSISNLKVIAKIFEVSIDYLVGNDEKI